ncbi:fibronectin type III domain-containing protein [Nonomuraea sp. NPDC047529]|uniref:fibronectin type III domain-containing protein n=1 Tax=Nonomuraea sp. NPDC047529 TaxID=3155623 RepID=UPI00340C53FC
MFRGKTSRLSAALLAPVLLLFTAPYAYAAPEPEPSPQVIEAPAKSRQAPSGLANLEITHAPPDGFEPPDQVRKSDGSESGDTATTSIPYGELEKVEHQPGWGNQVRVVGWAMQDATTTEPSKVRVYDRTSSWWTTADAHRPDVAHWGTGDNHGFDLMVPIAGTGQQTLCVRLYDRTGSVPGPEMCASFVIADPVGAITGLDLSDDGQIEVTGWAIDPDTADPIQVRIFDDGRLVTTVTADRPLDEDVLARYPAHGPDHGFAARVPASAGQGVHSVTVVAVNSATGTDQQVGQQYYVAPADATAPAVSFVVRAAEARVSLSNAGEARPWVRFESMEVPSGGEGRWVAHGALYLPNTFLYKQLKPDTLYRFRISAYNYRSTAEPVVFEQRTPRRADPVGALTELSWSGGDTLTLSGWAIDRDTEAPIQVRILEDGKVIATVTADAPLTDDVAAEYSDYGPGHAFTTSVPAPAAVGIHSYSVVAVKTPEIGGPDAPIGQQYFVAPDDVSKPQVTFPAPTKATETPVKVTFGDATGWVRFESMETPERGEGEWVVHDTLENPRQYVYRGLKPDTRYRYRVTAYNYRSTAEPVVAEARTIKAAPAAASELTVSKVEDEALTVRWKDNSGDEDSFELRIVDLDTSDAQVRKVPANAGTWRIDQRVDGLRSLGDYLIAVRPVRDGGEAQNPVTFQARTSGPAGINEFTVTPLNVSGSCPTSTFALSWTVSNTTRVVVKRKISVEEVLLDQQLTPSSPVNMPQTGTFTDTYNDVSAKTYTLIAYDASGRTTTRSVSFGSRRG